MNSEIDQKRDPCQYYCPDLVNLTLCDDRIALPLRRCWWNLRRYVWYISILGLTSFLSRMLSSTRFLGSASSGKTKIKQEENGTKVLNLKVGEYVEVRSLKDIFATLNAQGKLRGLRFTPEMAKYCGKRFRIYRKLDRILLEATGELRRIKTPTYLLEGVFCDGKVHGGCDRSCFCFWREEWLRRVPLTESI